MIKYLMFLIATKDAREAARGPREQIAMLPGFGRLAWHQAS
jgi:hypothetical protein